MKKTKKITQIVIYQPNPNNPDAAKRIIFESGCILGQIPNTVLRVGPAIPSDRAVAASNGTVVKMTTWPDQASKDSYFDHPCLKEWCQFVLCGWMLEGSVSADPAAEFIDHILSGKNKSVKWVRNPAVPEEDVVWAGETIILFEHEDDHAS